MIDRRALGPLPLAPLALLLPAALAALAGCAEPTASGGDDVVEVAPCGLSCDDGDFCTEDRCDAATKKCIHVPIDANNACRMDSHCDDGDPCTTDTCGFDAACPSLQRCQHAFVPGCRSCTDFNPSCDDGNPCTTETCDADHFCHYRTEPGCQQRCAMWSMGFYTVSQAQVGAVSLWGRATPSGGLSCSGTCACDKALVLTDDGGHQVSLTGLDAPWSCALATTCDTPSLSCTPLAAGREYVVFGEASAPTTPRDAAIPVPSDTAGGAQADVGNPVGPLATNLTVEGYCLALTDTGVAGHYAGTLLLDGASEPETFEATVLLDFERGQGPVVIFTGGGELLPEQTQPYELWTGYSLGVSFAVGGRFLTAVLYPGMDRLEGPVLDRSLGMDDPAGVPEPPPPGSDGARVGTLSLVLSPP